MVLEGIDGIRQSGSRGGSLLRLWEHRDHYEHG